MVNEQLRILEQPTARFAEDTVFAAMDVVSTTVKSRHCPDAAVLQAAMLVLDVARNPVPYDPLPFDIERYMKHDRE